MEKTFEIKSGKAVLSDPCYELGTWCQGVIDNVKNGVWKSEVVETSDGRIGRLFAYHKDYPIDWISIEQDGHFLKFDGGVDSGQFGFFDYDNYRNDESVNGVKRIAPPDMSIIDPENPFYSICCDRTLSYDMWGVIPFGVVASSGYGDGSYPTYGIKNGKGEYVGFSVVFIDESEKDFEDDEYDLYDDYESGNIPYDEEGIDVEDPTSEAPLPDDDYPPRPIPKNPDDDLPY